MNLAIAVVVSRYLGAEGRGVQSLFMTTISLVVTFTGLFGSAPLSFLFSRQHRISLLMVSYLWSLAISCCLLSVLYWVPLVPKGQIWHVVALGLVSSLAASNMSLFLAKERTLLFNLLQAAVPLATIMFLVVEFVGLGNTYMIAYVRALYFSNGVVFVVSFLKVKRLRQDDTVVQWNSFWNDTKEMLRYGFFNQTATIVQLVSYRGCYYILGWFVTESAIGIYANAVSLSESVWLIARSISLVVYARLLNIGNINGSRKVLGRALFTNAFVQLLAVGLLASVPTRVYTLLFGSEFSNMREVIWAIAPGIFLYGQSLVSGHFFSSIGKHYINLISNVIGLAVLLLSAMWLIPVYSVIGAALATSMGYASLLVVQNFYLQRHLGISVFEGLNNSLIVSTYYRYVKRKLISMKKKRG